MPPLGRPWASFGSLWGALGLPLAVLWGPFGRLGAPVCRLWASFGSLWGALGLSLAVLWGPFGCLGSPVGSLWGVFWILLKIDVIFRVKGSHLRCLRTKTNRSEFSRLARLARGNGVRKRWLDPTCTRAGGQDGVS